MKLSEKLIGGKKLDMRRSHDYFLTRIRGVEEDSGDDEKLFENDIEDREYR